MGKARISAASVSSGYAIFLLKNRSNPRPPPAGPLQKHPPQAKRAGEWVVLEWQLTSFVGLIHSEYAIGAGNDVDDDLQKRRRFACITPKRYSDKNPPHNGGFLFFHRFLGTQSCPGLALAANVPKEDNMVLLNPVNDALADACRKAARPGRKYIAVIPEGGGMFRMMEVSVGDKGLQFDEGGAYSNVPEKDVLRQSLVFEDDFDGIVEGRAKSILVFFLLDRLSGEFGFCWRSVDPRWLLPSTVDGKQIIVLFNRTVC